MFIKIYFILGVLFLSVKNSNSQDRVMNEDGPQQDYSQMHLIDVDKISLSDDLSKYTMCKDVFYPDSEIMKICKNNSICRLLPGHEGYLQVFCDCSNTVTETHYFMGPQCETKMVIYYNQNVYGIVNTSWLEDIFSLNSWKNDFSRVGPLF
ncbi:hypothetical protein TpMuguga_04g02075 [Theileria parva strain Muguga]|uniref:uncharacterized protein n=1 Tax=Theileria parva strain Muguga TaxID=333668 RepID=UPI001C61E95A|nr:uncharacterized protein TpMuguga_04g02075 [Theileria parva strain Muguga]KAF5153268.1 hypothetical protein TpMuguga_04g02075 [Theileria parva strain Muguga]